MFHINNPFSKEPKQEPKLIYDEMINFYLAKTADECKRILENNPELLSPEMGNFFDDVTKNSHGDGQVRAVERRALLARCREVGIDKAFAEITHETKYKTLEQSFQSQNVDNSSAMKSKNGSGSKFDTNLSSYIYGTKIVDARYSPENIELHFRDGSSVNFNGDKRAKTKIQCTRGWATGLVNDLADVSFREPFIGLKFKDGSSMKLNEEK